MTENDDRRPGKETASNVTNGNSFIVNQIGCLCGHFFDEDCIRHLPVEGTGARYKAAQKNTAA